ncbi:dTMP kinase [Conexibacter sp. JD483]|uniref:dTMP kinase n=1 Tax=unclassified Conexibacter TaxID=2627773 RepID=UPI002720E190|nr:MULTISPECIES: dTMP kinase [unclassified Conexibacter]MDO8186617.1 dTMP kinase [Conexibacter sp. CPCC 205706]MDO8196722.1 dTMP kinase [Conexibacter sp. CPCC 205762]MDR9370911.1 dTMP kinase [Conexibacter sp. JD483]
MSDERGRFIVLEGIDGAGTTTQAALLADALRERLGVAVELTREPTDGPLGRLLREALSGRAPLDPVTLALAFAADRADHVHNPRTGIEAALAAGHWVVSDRYVLSSLAYNRGGAVTADWLTAINRHALAPDLTLFLVVDPQLALERIAARGGEPELFETREQLVAIDRAYRELIGDGAVDGPLLPLDGAAPVDEVAAAVWRAAALTAR